MLTDPQGLTIIPWGGRGPPADPPDIAHGSGPMPHATNDQAASPGLPPRWPAFLLILGLYLTLRGYHAFDGDQAYRLPLLLSAPCTRDRVIPTAASLPRYRTRRSG